MVNKSKRVRTSTSYVGTFDVRSAEDMIKLENFKKTIKSLNEDLKKARAVNSYGSPMRYRVALKGRRPFQKEINLRTGRPISYTWAGDVVGGLANASQYDVYLYRR